jgi:hypothetical protein
MDITDLRNPFCLGSIEGPDQFFGRERETRRALSFLHQGQSVSVVEPAKTGKTSFLLHAAHPDVRARHGLTKEHVFVYVDSRLLADCDQDQCFLLISEETIRQVKDALPDGEGIGTKLESAFREASLQTISHGFQALFRTARVGALKLVLLLDDFESLTENSRLQDNFFSLLRWLHTNYQVAYLVASRSPLDVLERIPPSNSPFFNIFQTIPLESLTPEESHRLIITQLDQASVDLPPLAVNCILELGDNRPYRLQRAGHIAFQLWQESGGTLQVEHCEIIREQFVEDEHRTKHT